MPRPRHWLGGGSLRTPDPPGPWLPPSRRGEPRHGMRRGLEPRAHEGRWRAVPVPKGQPFSWSSTMAGGSEPQERGPQRPRPSSFSHIWASLRPQACHAQPRHSWPHPLAAVTIDITMASVTSHLMGPYKRGTLQLAHQLPSLQALRSQACLDRRGARAARQMAAHLCVGQRRDRSHRRQRGRHLPGA